MRSVFQFLGTYPVAGVVTTFIACTALTIWEYIRLKEVPRQLVYLPLVRYVALGTGFLSTVLIASRFIAVWFPS